MMEIVQTDRRKGGGRFVPASFIEVEKEVGVAGKDSQERGSLQVASDCGGVAPADEFVANWGEAGFLTLVLKIEENHGGVDGRLRLGVILMPGLDEPEARGMRKAGVSVWNCSERSFGAFGVAKDLSRADESVVVGVVPAVKFGGIDVDGVLNGESEGGE